LVLGAQFSEAVLPAEAAQQPRSDVAGGAIASGQLLALRVEPLDRRGEVSHRPRPVSWRLVGRFTWEPELRRAHDRSD